jgi:hypothetical protein
LSITNFTQIGNVSAVASTIILFKRRKNFFSQDHTFFSTQALKDTNNFFYANTLFTSLRYYFFLSTKLFVCSWKRILFKRHFFSVSNRYAIKIISLSYHKNIFIYVINIFTHYFFFLIDAHPPDKLMPLRSITYAVALGPTQRKTYAVALGPTQRQTYTT